MNVVTKIAEELSARETQVEAAVALLDEGATVPFIARYRKEATGGLDDTQLRLLEERLRYLRELEERRAAILKSLEERKSLSPELEAAIRAAETKTRLEDLYLPFRPKRRTKAQIAREAGLEPLADRLLSDPTISPEEAAAEFVNEEKGVADVAQALEGARSILAERFAEDAEVSGEIRELIWRDWRLASKVVSGKEKEGAKFSDYYDYSEPLRKVPSHRALALLRGRSSGILRLFLAPPERPSSIDPQSPESSQNGSGAERSEGSSQRPISVPEAKIAQRFGIRDEGRAADAWLLGTVRDSWSTKLLPRLETDLILRIREAAEEEAIRVFARNLHDLLLAAPAGPKVTIGLDPGLRTGVKFAVIDGTGKLLEHGTIWPHAPRNDREGSISTLAELARKHQVEIIAIGNGTASRETDRLVKELIQRHPDLGLERLVVNEAGASVYSASEIAAKEFPNVDVSFRGAVSIARRLQDPLAELVKIEPRSIGVGQYQHDVNQTRLARALDAVVEDCVNAVGVDVNTASAQLLTRVSGLNRALAENIVLHRDEHGPFRRRSQLLDVPRMGEKSYEQSAGFLRIMNGEDPLDASAVHPESYPIVQKIVERTQKSVRELMSDAAFLRTLDPKDYVDDTFGLPTVTDIIRELEKPGRDPRPDFVTASFAEGVESLEDLKPDMIVEGVVTNVTNFGAFVDIGVHQDGLVHISRLSSRFVKDPREVVKPGDVVKVKVLQVDTERKRVGLSMRLDEDASAESEGGASGGARGGRGGRRREGRGPRRRPSGAEGRGSAGASAEGRGPGGGDRDRPRGRRDGGRRGGDRRHGAPGGGRRGDGGRRDVEPSGARGGRPRDEGPTLFGRLLDQALEEARRRKEKE